MIRVLIAVDNRKVLEENKYISIELKKDLHDLCLMSGFICTYPNRYMCEYDNKDIELGCFFKLISNLSNNPPIFNNLECFLMRQDEGELSDCLEELTTIKYNESVNLKKEPLPIRKSDISRFTSDDHWKDW